jgi:hypothetical protein
VFDTVAPNTAVAYGFTLDDAHPLLASEMWTRNNKFAAIFF